ncbi:MAG: hypothetical protein ACOC9O_03095 [Myxococcota bacterium]
MIAVLVALAGVAGCSVGVGEGSATGQVWAPTCDLDGDDYDMEPSFFGADVLVDGADLLEIRMQRGSDRPEVSDGLVVQVNGASTVHAMLGTPIDLSDTDADALAEMSLYLNDTCPFEIGDPAEAPVAYVSTGGTLTFSAIYAPEVDDSGKVITATFEDVELVDPADPAERRAVLSGDFDFIFSRGRPAQPFP